MNYLGFFLVGFLFLFSCNNANSSKVAAVEKSTTAAKVVASDIKKEVETQLAVEEKYVAIEETKIEQTNIEEKPALKPKKEIRRTVEKVTTRSGSQPIEKKDNVPAAPQESEVIKDKPAPLRETATKAITEAATAAVTSTASKPALQPVPQKEETVEDVRPTKSTNEKKPAPAKLSHEPFDKLLSTHVSASGKVNYKGLKSQSAELDLYLAALESAELSTMSKKEKLAFWINAYNAFTIKKILNAYPVASITDLDGGKPWDTKWIKLDGRTLSLNNIENDIIRPQFNEPRIHFAVNCAAKSCPPLLNKAWTAANLEANFEKQTKAFVNNASHNQLAAKSCSVSKIFEWYAEDFGDLISFLNKYSSTTIDKGAQLSYLDYDWSLNE